MKEIEIKSQGKIVMLKNIDIDINANLQISNEVANKSDLVTFNRNFELSLVDQIRGFRNNSFNYNTKSNLDNNSLINIINPEPNQINRNNSVIITNIENKLNNNNISSNNMMERSGSIFSFSSSNSIKIHSKMNPRVSIIQRLRSSSKHKKSTEFSRTNSNFMSDTNYMDDKLEDIEDNEEMSDNSNFDENLDSSGEFTKIMKKSEKPKNSLKSKNSIYERTNSMYSLSMIKEVFNNKNSNNDSSLKERETSFDNYNNKDRNSVDDKYREQILDYLKINNYSIIYQKIYRNEITAKELIKLDDDRIVEMVEEENKEKFSNLIKFIMNLEDSCDYDDLFKKIDNDIFNG